MKKWLIATFSAVILIPLIMFGRDAVIRAFANSEKVPTIEQAVIEQREANAEMKGMIEKEDRRADMQEKDLASQKEITTIQIQALKEIVAELKR